MSTRQERRRQKSALKKDLQRLLRQKGITDRAARELLVDEIEREQGTEVYRLDDDGYGKPLYFNISAMRSWAQKHCEVFGLPMDMARAQRLAESGAVDPDHMFNHTMRREMIPILVCRNLVGADQIVDGAHRYVAACMGAATFGMDFPVPGYVLMPEQWSKFVISEKTTVALEM